MNNKDILFLPLGSSIDLLNNEEGCVSKKKNTATTFELLIIDRSINFEIGFDFFVFFY